MTAELTTTQMLVAGLQREAETQLNQLFCLKATLSAKEYDIEAKDDLISSLADEVRLVIHSDITIYSLLI